MMHLKTLAGCGMLATLLASPALFTHVTSAPVRVASSSIDRAAPAAPAAPAAVASLATVDWNDFTYTTACFSSHPHRFVAHKGLAQAGFIHFQVYQPLFGDLTGDGQPEAIVPYSCTGADFGGVHLFVFTGTSAQPRLLGEVPAPSGSGSLGTVTAVTFPIETATTQHPVLQINGFGYSATATHDCPDLRITLSYRVEGDRLIEVGSTTQHSSRCL